MLYETADSGNTQQIIDRAVLSTRFKKRNMMLLEVRLPIELVPKIKEIPNGIIILRVERAYY